MIEARDLTKHYGSTLAVDRLSFTVRPGTVTGFLGPNGSGKSTTMRMIMDLDAPDAGQALIGGQPYHELRWPLREVGALLEARAFHPGRSARAHLTALAAANAIPRGRVDEVLGAVGLLAAAGRRAGTFSLGMSQRLGIAAALLGDPEVLLFDEPVNGLDPEGVRWIRGLIKSLATRGRTVFVSSHLISEMALTAERLIVIGRGRLLADTTVAELAATRHGSLEDAFFALTGDSAEYRGRGQLAQRRQARPGLYLVTLGRAGNRGPVRRGAARRRVLAAPPARRVIREPVGPGGPLRLRTVRAAPLPRQPGSTTTAVAYGFSSSESPPSRTVPGPCAPVRPSTAGNPQSAAPGMIEPSLAWGNSGDLGEPSG